MKNIFKNRIDNSKKVISPNDQPISELEMQLSAQLNIVMSNSPMTDRQSAYNQIRETFYITKNEAGKGVGIRSRPQMIPISGSSQNAQYLNEEREFYLAVARLPTSVRRRVEFRLLADTIGHPEIQYRNMAILALGDLRSRVAIPILSEFLLDWLHYDSLSDEGASLRGTAAQSLVTIAEQNTMDLLVASIELDRINIKPQVDVQASTFNVSIRNGITRVESPFAKEILVQHDRGDIDWALVRNLLLKISDESRITKFIPLVDHRNTNLVIERVSFSSMLNQAKSQLEKLNDN